VCGGTFKPRSASWGGSAASAATRAHIEGRREGEGDQANRRRRRRQFERVHAGEVMVVSLDVVRGFPLCQGPGGGEDSTGRVPLPAGGSHCCRRSC
jgi:hypothetical protein